MKQTINTCLIILLMLSSFSNAFAYDCIVDGIYYNLNNVNNTATVTNNGNDGSGSSCYSGEVIIPEKINYNGTEYTVTTIGRRAFYECYFLKSVTIPSSVTSIGASAFYYCISLNPTITIPNSVTSIGESAFYYCLYLTSVTIPNSVTTIGNSAFCICFNLTEVTIPNSVTTIGESAFYGCRNLTSVTIPNSVTSIGESAFYNCYNINSLTIGANVLNIGSNAFSFDYDSNKYIEIPKVIWLPNTPPKGMDEVKGLINYVANEQYTGLSGETNLYKFLSSMFEVGDVKYVPVSPSDRTCDAIDCVYGPQASKSINIGNTVTYNGVSMTLQDIKSYTCYGNDSIRNITIDYSGDIGESAFSECNSIESIKIKAKNIGNDAFLNSMTDNTATVEIEVTGNIGDSAFKGCHAISSLKVKAKKISDSAFYECNSLETATLQEGLKSIGSSAFAECRKLKGITIPNSVETMGRYTFSNCKSLEYANIGTGIKIIDDGAFSGCSSLQEIEIPKNVESIGNNVFYGCTSLANVTITNRKTELRLGYNSIYSSSSPMFSDCPLKMVYIGGNIQYPTSEDEGYSPFYRNTSLETVTITDKETEISENEFYGCTNLKTITMGDGVESIGNWAFSGCTSLDYFEFGSGMKTIGEEAFSDCNAMTKLISKAAVPPICGTQALDDINKWSCKLQVPKGALESYKSAEQWKEFFFIEEHSGIESILDDEISATVSDGNILVNGAEERQMVEVYGINGQLMYKGTDTTISVPMKGMYIVRVAGKAFKVAL